MSKGLYSKTGLDAIHRKDSWEETAKQEKSGNRCLVKLDVKTLENFEKFSKTSKTLKNSEKLSKSRKHSNSQKLS